MRQTGAACISNGAKRCSMPARRMRRASNSPRPQSWASLRATRANSRRCCEVMADALPEAQTSHKRLFRIARNTITVLIALVVFVYVAIVVLLYVSQRDLLFVRGRHGMPP